jgi:hypothetical protein
MGKAKDTANTLRLVPASSADVQLDWVGSYRRLKEVVEILKDYAGRHGLSFNEEDAERSLAYIRAQSAGAPDDPDDWEAMIRFVDRYDQSLDWIFRGAVRLLIYQSAAAAFFKRAI